jgi:hypothetical protein
MTALIPIFILGALLVLFSGRLLLQSARGATKKRGVTVEDYTAARAEVDEVLVETAAIRRIFALDDLRFVTEDCPTTVHPLFREERKALAVLWVRRSQKQLAHLMDLHLRLASYTRQPCPNLEMRVAMRYWAFLVVSHFLLVLLWLRGPFETVRVIQYIARMPGELCMVFAPRLEDVDLMRLGSTVEGDLSK